MPHYTFYTNPMSRGQIARWALHEAGAEYATVLVDWADKPAALIAANPMGKVPVIIHHAEEGDRVVSECAAICAYLAEMHPERQLGPSDTECADYLRWLFFAAGPLEQAVVNNSFGWKAPKPQDQGRLGYGCLDDVVRALAGHLAAHDYIADGRFTAADVYVGSQVGWGLQFGTLPAEPAFTAYWNRIKDRPARTAAEAKDNALMERAK